MMNTPVNTDKWRNDVKQWSLWSLMMKYYSAKEAYYLHGNSELTDYEFDSLESSIIAIHGEEIIKSWGCVGYDKNKHIAVKRIFTWWDYVDKKNNKAHNEWAGIRSTFEDISEPEVIETIIIPKENYSEVAHEEILNEPVYSIDTETNQLSMF